jgi:hypothetical protein
MNADRVWLIVHNEPKEDAGQPFSKLITESLRERRIELRLQRADRLIFRLLTNVGCS